MINKCPEQLLFIKNSRTVQKKSDESMDGKICVVSGATSGVGYEAVKKLAAGKADIVMLVRNEKKAKAVKKELEKKHSIFVDYFIADFSDLKQVEKAVRAIVDKYPRVDVLINSAGIHSTKKILNKDGYEMVFCVNHLASFLITNLLLNRLIESSPSRIIQVNSEGHRFNGLKTNDLNWEKRIYTGLRSYGASKTAQLLTVRQLAENLKDTGVTINAMHPGGVKTNIGNNNGRLYRWFLHHVTWHFLKDPEISGEAIYYLASASELSNISGKFFNLTIEEKPAKHALDSKKQEEIWNLSLEMTGLIQKGG
ncbi:NAD(P)-dependent dehydrogenase, short-chain alcohol dehydrogenase family [Carnobacterium alterfunditum]|uniref:NAD(P)-dependent dehydrogenase, short-chain alcohol dehydrogenase family n=2 Tax=Carnobacterium alterfunditum TaxID=28230 RepID=A0A1N6GCY6_9LACT|nr:SDR family NAD(P)-dependent oxidoreductase [Carnobacterium alterfunditum]SIO05344.1 NAD(P)-dependent dehydrogenase, short-chain alcohol dehydrogenase family [Carnobacterium alterfunditum]